MKTENIMDTLIVGAGHIGNKEILELSNHPTIRVVGLVETDEKRRNAFTDRVPATYSSVATAIDETSPDLVRIATPPHTHAEIGKRALSYGCDVYIEKIMTLRAEEARELQALSEQHGCSIYVRRNAIYTPIYQRAWSRLPEIGTVRRVIWSEPTGSYIDWSTTKANWLRNLPGGIISEHLPHALYLLRWYLDAEPTVSRVIHEGKELHVSMETENAQASISYTNTVDQPMLLTVIGSDGVMIVDHSEMRIRMPRGFESIETVSKRTLAANAWELWEDAKNIGELAKQYILSNSGLGTERLYRYTDHYRQFDDIVNGRTTASDFPIDGEEGVRNVELFEEIWEEANEY